MPVVKLTPRRSSPWVARCEVKRLARKAARNGSGPFWTSILASVTSGRFYWGKAVLPWFRLFGTTY